MSNQSPWARPTDCVAADAAEPTGEADVDLDWARRTIVELDDRQRTLAADDLAGRHAILQTIDDLRTMLRQGYTDELHAVRGRWSERSSRQSSREIDHEAIAGMVRSMMPSR